MEPPSANGSLTSRALGVRAGWPAAPHLQEPPERRRQLLGAVDPGRGPLLWGAGRSKPVRDGLRVPRPPQTRAWVLGDPWGREGLSAGCAVMSTLLLCGQQGPRLRRAGVTGRRCLAPRVPRAKAAPCLAAARSSGRPASERSLPCHLRSAQVHLRP